MDGQRCLDTGKVLVIPQEPRKMALYSSWEQGVKRIDIWRIVVGTSWILSVMRRHNATALCSNNVIPSAGNRIAAHGKRIRGGNRRP